MNSFRRARFRRFFSRLGVGPDTAILDVGGLPGDWLELAWPGPVTCVSLSPYREGLWGGGNVRYVRHDATELPFDDASFDVVYSNSLLEHVGRASQAAVASEIRRVGRGYWVQVPYRGFPYEPHYCCPFFWQLPRAARRALARSWTELLGRVTGRGNPYAAELETMHLPARAEFRALFPDGELAEERVLGLTKSLIAIRPRARRAAGRRATRDRPA